MSTASEISVVRVSPLTERLSNEAGGAGEPANWRGSTRRPSAITLGALAVLAGLAAMTLGGLALLSVAQSDDTRTGPTASPAPIDAPGVAAERRALALLAKPSTERVVFRGSGGRLVLVVGSGGRAVLLIRGLERAAASLPYRAWVVGSQRVVRAAAFTGGERAVVLSASVGRGASVVVATNRSAALRPGADRLVAARS